jgi:RNA polymerase sigma factor (sigma-70 family)
MATGRLANLVRSARAAPLPDGDLLDAFLRRHDEAAFEQLVRRHGPMVLGVCRRVLGSTPDADDAFQAAFLVLVRKAGSIVPRDLVGPWLYGVARRTALRARSLRMRRHQRERQVERLPEPAGVGPDAGDVRDVLDEELSALPEAFRTVVVLCDLCGASHREAARQLRVAEGTVASRLSRGRALLRQRLSRRGVALTVGAGALADQAVASVPPALVSSTVRFAAGPANLVPPQVVDLVEGVTQAMFLSKLKIAMAIPVVLLAAVVGVAQIKAPGEKPAAPPTRAADPPKAAPAEEPISHTWITEKAVQEELRLSEKQVKEITEVRQGVWRAFEKEMKAAQAEAAKGNYKKAREVQKAWQDALRKAFAEAGPKIVSEAAQTRLRQIQRQASGLHRLVRDPAVQKRLKLTDDQAKQIDGFLKAGDDAYGKAMQERAAGKTFLLPQTIEEAIVGERTAYAGAMKQVLGVFTDAQRRTWDAYVGEPFAFKAEK